MKYVVGLMIALCGWLLAGCQTPYGTSQTPHVSASISDDTTSATLNMGAIGEFTFVATHSHLADGSTTGSVQIKGTKDTANNLIVGTLSAVGGLIAGKGL